MTETTYTPQDLQTIDEITARQLRKILFYISDDSMTVRELRAELFYVEPHDDPVKVDHSMSHAFGLRIV